jgi:hypothetical protein
VCGSFSKSGSLKSCLHFLHLIVQRFVAQRFVVLQLVVLQLGPQQFVVLQLDP